MAVSELLNIIVASIGLLVSIVAIYVSISAAKRETRLELFEKRFDIYYACVTICNCCSIGKPNMVIPILENRNVKCTEPYISAAEFLFDKRTYSLVCDIWSKWNAMRSWYDCLEEDIPPLDVNKNFEELKAWFSVTKDTLDKPFKKYLDLRSIK